MDLINELQFIQVFYSKKVVGVKEYLGEAHVPRAFPIWQQCIRKS